MTASETTKWENAIHLSFFLEENDGMRKPRFFFFFSGVASVAVGEAADTCATVNNVTISFCLPVYIHNGQMPMNTTYTQI